jgi:hypothetical protein
MEKIEYVTAADLRAWTYPTRDSENRVHAAKSKPLGNPKPPRPKKERVVKDRPEASVIEAQARQKRVNDAVRYKKTVDQCKAVVNALEIVTVRLGYDLTTQNTTETKKARRRGWHTFCAIIQLTCEGYTMRGIDAAIPVPGKPCREVLSNMFECCRKECGYSEVELKQLIS